MIRPEHPFDIRPDLRKAASTKAASVIRPNQLVRGISIIKKFTSGMGWGMTPPRGLRYKAFNLPSHPDHKYIWLRSGELNH